MRENVGIQLNLKIGPQNNHLLNIYGDEWEDFKRRLDAVKENVVELTEALTLFSPQPNLGIGDARAVPPMGGGAPQPAMPQASLPQPNGQEVGPLLIEKIEESQGTIKKGPRTGQPYVRSVVVFSGGLRASTFDTLIAQAAKALIGRNAYATVRKTEQYGYELDAVRAA